MALIVINVWLAFLILPISSGALQAIPTDVWGGRHRWGQPQRQFRGLTLPLLLVSVDPLLISSFTVLQRF